MTIIAKIVYFTIDAISWKGYDILSYCTGSLISALPVFFFSIAVILNINKWVYFYFRIREGVEGNNDKYRKMMVGINVITYILLAIIIVVHVTLISISCA